MNSPASAEIIRERGNRRASSTLCGLALLIALPLQAGCQTDRDPRTGGFIDGVDNLVSGGYSDFVQEKRNELDTTQDEALVLEARAQAIQSERDALDHELEYVARDLKLLQDRLIARRAEFDAAKQATAAERRRLEEAESKTKLAQIRFEAYRQDRTQSIEAARKEVDDLKNLIGTIGAIVSELSG